MRLSALAAFLILVCNGPAFAQDSDRGWIDVDFMHLQPTQDLATFTYARSMFSETAAVAAAYPKLPGVNGLGVSGGVGIKDGLGIEVGWNGVNYDSTVGLALNIPSPYFYNTPATASGPTSDTLRREDRSIDLGAVYTLPTSRSFRVRLFGGPTYFQIKNNMVHVVNYNQVASAFFYRVRQ